MKQDPKPQRFHAAFGLGANIGDPKKNLSQALTSIAQCAGINLDRVSKLYQTPPWGGIEQPDFLNACVTIYTSLSPQALLAFCLSLESRMGRTRDTRWGPRTIDIDVLFYEDLQVDEERLQLPHPRMSQRAFVMVPLADIAPDKLVFEKSVKAWADELQDDEMTAVSVDGNWW